MMTSLVLTVLVGAGLGAGLGYFGKCSTGSCPLTANWRRGALYGATLGLLFHAVLPHDASSPAESTQNVRLIQESQFEPEVLQATEPVVVDFFATWCGPCKRLSPMLDELAEPLTNQVKFVKIDVDRSARLAEQFGIQAVPTVLIFRNGKVVDKIVGLPSRGALKVRLDSLAVPANVAATLH